MHPRNDYDDFDAREEDAAQYIERYKSRPFFWQKDIGLGLHSFASLTWASTTISLGVFHAFVFESH
jgi:hypothetical protein